MYFKVEPSGCIVAPENQERRQREGCWVQVVFRFYLEDGDPGFEKYKKEQYVHVPVDWKDYEKWVASLDVDSEGHIIFPNPNDKYDGYPGTKHWVYNPLVNHVIWLEPTLTDEEILDVGEGLAKIYAEKCRKEESLKMPSEKPYPTTATSSRIIACETRVGQIKNVTLERKIIISARALERNGTN